MKDVEFKCVHCGNQETVEILPLKHAVRTTKKRMDEEARCCKNPEYADNLGFSRLTEEGSLLGFMPRLRT